MEYKLLTQQGALQEGRDHALSDDTISEFLGESAGTHVANKRKSKLAHRNRPLPIPGHGVVELITESMARENMVMPLRTDGVTVTLACLDPADISLADKLRFIMNREVELIPASADELTTAINRSYGMTETGSVDSLLAEFTETQIDFTEVDAAKRSHGDAAFHRRRTRRVPQSPVVEPTAIFKIRPKREPSQRALTPKQGQSMFHFTVDEGERVLMTRFDGRSEVLMGPLALRAENLKFAHEQRRQESAMTDEIRRRKFESEQGHYKALAGMGVELTQYLTQARADQVIELRGEGTKPHVHLGNESSAK